MKTKRIKAIFIGEDGSLGFRINHQYELIIKQKGDNIDISDVGTPSAHVEYGSIVAFLTNWDDIRNVQ